MPAPNLGLVGAYGAAGVQDAIQQMVAERRAAEKLAFEQAIANRKTAAEERNAQTNEYEALARLNAPRSSPSLIQMTGLAPTGDEAPGAYKGLWDPTSKSFQTRQRESPDAPSSSSAEFERFMGSYVIPARKQAGLPDLTPEEVIDWKKKYGTADDAEKRDFMQRLVQTGSEQLIWDPNTQTMRRPPAPGAGPGGEPTRMPLPATSEQRNLRAAGQRAQPILQGVSDLSERINTGSGLIAKISGEVEKAKAMANYNDDLAEYNSLISMFTPSIARAVGHVGVLTQQDVDSVKEMFPKPGDSKSLRDRKIGRLTFLLDSVSTAGADEPAVGRPPASPAGAPPPAAGVSGAGGRRGPAPQTEGDMNQQLVPYTNKSFVPVLKDGVWWGKDAQGGWVQVDDKGKYIIGR